MFLSQCHGHDNVVSTLLHVVRVRSCEAKGVTVVSAGPVVVGLHFHSGRSVPCVGDNCPVCFSEGIGPRQYVYLAALETTQRGAARGEYVFGRRFVLELPWRSWVQVLDVCGCSADSPDVFGQVLVVRRAKGLRSPVEVRRVAVWHGLAVVDERTVVNSLFRWLGMPLLNGDREAWLSAVGRRVQSVDHYRGTAKPSTWSGGNEGAA